MNTKRGIPLPRVEGTAPRQAHADLPRGSYEREFGSSGFFGPATHLLHAHPPTGWVRWDGPLRPRAVDLRRREDSATGPWMAPRLLHTARTALRVWRLAEPMKHLARNADGDQLLFVHDGEGDLFCDFGHLAYSEGDYVCLPRGTQFRLEPRHPSTLLMVEATDSTFGLPERGMLGHHAVFDPAVLRTPRLNDAFDAQRSEAETQVLIKRHGHVSTVTFPYNPLDTLGYQGDLLPVQLNWRDIRPVMSHRYHLPPSVHTTFVAERFVVCTFCPRPIETDPGALKVPFFHANNDYDEVLFYHRGDFFSRDNIHAGMLSLHPAGFAHGPHPKALRNSQDSPKRETDEVAVMVDTRDALEVSDQAASVEWSGYVDSWR